ncbi:MAG: hypothetical protein ACFFD5_09075 [Candidatus Thorarchaeota archaeon]
MLENLELYYGDLKELKKSSQVVKSEKKPFISEKIILIVIFIFSFAESTIFSFFLPNGTQLITIIFDFSLIFGWMTLFNIIFFVPNSKDLFLKAIKKLWIEALYINIESKVNYTYQLRPKFLETESENKQEQEAFALKALTIK